MHNPEGKMRLSDDLGMGKAFDALLAPPKKQAEQQGAQRPKEGDEGDEQYESPTHRLLPLVCHSRRGKGEKGRTINERIDDLYYVPQREVLPRVLQCTTSLKSCHLGIS